MEARRKEKREGINVGLSHDAAEASYLIRGKARKKIGCVYFYSAVNS